MSERSEKETGRVEAFSDGVFSIAATLLVLGIAAPTAKTLGDGQTLAGFLASNWVSFAAYAVSFVTILVMWLNHHSMFQYVARVDRLFMVLNGLLLMFVVLVNYPTALVAEFITREAHSGQILSDAQVATMFYSATLIAIAVLYNALWFRAASGRRLIAEHIDQAEIDRISRQYRFGGTFYLAAFLLAIFSPYLSVALNGALALYFAFTGQIGDAERDRVRTRQAGESRPPGGRLLR